MKSIYRLLITVLFAGFVLYGCDGEFDSLVDANADRNPIPDTEIEASQGDADFTNYVAIGNSLTAGFMDGALYNNGQRFSLGALLSAQFEYTGAPSTFNQPDINSANGFNTQVNTGDGVVLGRFKLDTNIPGPSPTVNGDQITPYDGSASALNNFGVPGIRVGELLTPETAENNPFYGRFASSPGSSTILEDAISANPTFFSLWIGSNDVLGYALGGATNPSALTSTEAFQNNFSQVVEQLVENTSAQGIVANIPPVLAVPLFQAVPRDAVELDQATADQLNAGFSGFDQALDAIVSFLGHSSEDADRRRVSYQAGNNPILIVDPNLENLGPKFDTLRQFGGITQEQREALQPYVRSRPIETGELVLLPAASVLGTLADPSNPNTPIGVVIPLGAQYTLTQENIVEIETARGTFNAIIESVVDNANAQGARLAFYDTNEQGSAFSQMFGFDGSGPGITVDGIDLEPDFSPSGVFSTDGVHPNARGNAILANEFIRAIEAEFNATIPRVDVLALPSVSLCAGDCVSQQGGS
ncbi:SGNH/GDSL hydrolase family protein [Rhodohalobacter sp. SW132]|uniref:SGNH/GDSL hydrolase family protein n=1 Tax=Rhodohalobacter sp. SW132 TaxID=2293433 RepID=UPI001314EC3B|nr:SGNH/GDSL hydrolase family protein [Rhodohalobacter sp. SW132]